VVMAPTDYTYLDYYQSTDHSHEPVAIGGFVPLTKVYGYEPIPSALTPAQAHHVLGAQCQLWTEYMPNGRHVEYMAFPRVCALAEVAWSLKSQRDFTDFSARLRPHLERLDALDVNYRPLDGPATAPISTWKSGQMSETFTAHSWPLTVKVGPGDYTVTFSYTDGSCRLDIKWVEFVQGDTVIARDEHPAHTGANSVGNVYTLHVNHALSGQKTVLRAMVRTDGGTDSAGEIRLAKG